MKDKNKLVFYKLFIYLLICFDERQKRISFLYIYYAYLDPR